MGPNEILDKGFIVTTPVPQFHVVEQTGTQEMGLLTDAGGDWLGIAQEEADQLDADRGRVVRVRPFGISRGVAGATFARRTRLAADANGRLVEASGGDNVVGIALTEPAAVGDWVDVQLTPGLVAAGA